MKTFVNKTHGIKFHFAGTHIENYKLYDFLKLEPDPTNEYDSNAIKIIDLAGNHIGFVASDINKFVLSIINGHDYYCFISNVYYDREKPSIEYTIVYREHGETNSDFEDNLLRYRKSFSEEENEEIDDFFGDIDIKKRKTKMSPEEKKKAFYNGLIKCRDGFYEDSFKLLEPLAEEDQDPNALYFCAYMLYDGKGVARDYQRAFNYFCLAKEKGYQRADFEIGRFYESGIVVKKDINKAIEYYEKAAYQNRCFEALHRLASMYFTGIGKPCDINKFFECIKLVYKYNAEIKKEMSGGR